MVQQIVGFGHVIKLFSQKNAKLNMINDGIYLIFILQTQIPDTGIYKCLTENWKMIWAPTSVVLDLICLDQTTLIFKPGLC